MDELEQIKSKLDLPEFIATYLPLKKAGRNFRACCPFHQEKTPSFTVSPERQIWKCFGCGKGGDVFGFLMEYEKMTFIEALRFLAEKTGVKLAKSVFFNKFKDEKDTILEVNHMASEYYHFVLNSLPVGVKAKEYLAKRGVSKESIELFTLGYAPHSFDSLTKYLLKKNYDAISLVKAGLAIKTSSGLKDRFFGRLMFPLFDARGNVIAFAGRVLDPAVEQNKYINTAETLVYHKSETLYGFNVTKEHIRKEDEAVIVEGEIDLIKIFQSGTKNAVAIKGSALTKEQVLLLKRYTPNLKICLDTDLAGKLAALRGISIAESESMNIKVVELLAGKDPDECVSKDIKTWKKSLAEAESIYDFYLKFGQTQYSLQEVTGQKNFMNFVFPKIDAIENLVIRDHFVKKLARILGTTDEVIIKEMDNLRKKIKTLALPKKSSLPNLKEEETRRSRLENQLLSLLLQSDSPKKLRQVAEDLALTPANFAQPAVRRIIEELWDFLEREIFTIQNFVLRLPEELRFKADELYLTDLGFENLLEVETLEFKRAARELCKLNLKEAISQTLADMKMENEDSPAYASLNDQLRELTERLKSLD